MSDLPQTASDALGHQNGHHGKPRRPKTPRGNGRPPDAPEHCQRRFTPRNGWRFRAAVRVGGKRVYGTWGTREEATRERDQIVERRKASADVHFITLHDACQMVLDTVKDRTGTWRSYEEHFHTLCAHFGPDTPLHEITAERVDQFLHHRRGERIRGKAPGELRLRKNLTALNRVFRLATMKRRFAGANPIDQIERPKATRKPAGHYSVDEVEAILTKISERKSPAARRSWAIVATLTFTGLRRDELCRLQVRQVDTEGGFLRGVQGKTGIRDVPITKPLALVLPVLMEGLHADDHLVPAGNARGPRQEGNRPRTDLERREGILNGLFMRTRKDLRESLRARFHPHTMRHTLRTILADAGVPRHVKDAITGHASSGISGHYEHATNTAVRMWATKVLDPLAYLVDPAVEKPKAAQA